jgi:hypothetical protein
MLENVEEVKPVSTGISTTAKFTAWSKHCCIFYDELVELLVDGKYILAKDIIKASALVSDIYYHTRQVPFNDKLIDMTNDLYHWITMSIRGHELKELFAPPET